MAGEGHAEGEREGRRIANERRGEGRAQRARDPESQHVGEPSALSENAPGSPKDSRGTHGLQGRAYRENEGDDS